MTLEELETKLQSLRGKWKNDYPKSAADPRWPEFEADRDEARRLITEIEKTKKSNESEVDCYQCQKKKAIHGADFPFCSPECKKEWQDKHTQEKPVGKRYTTIEECQARCKELARKEK